MRLNNKTGFGRQTAVAALWVGLSMALCGGLYSGIIRIIGRVLVPDKADGSLIAGPDGRLVGSRLIAQAFARPEYFCPRPSAVDHDASRSGSSNLNPSSVVLKRRIGEAVRRFGATSDRPLPPDLVFASGSGLDPHLSLEAALFQVDRVAQARGVAPNAIGALVTRISIPQAGPLGGRRLVNVLSLNLELDRTSPLESGTIGKPR